MCSFPFDFIEREAVRQSKFLTTKQKMSDNTIGVDIGATKIHIGVVQNSEVIKELKFPTSAESSKEEIMLNLIKGIEKVSGSDFNGIGIGVPGLVDEEEGVIYDLLNISSWKEVHLKKELETHFNKPVRITNDANIFALGEKIFGQGGPYRNLVGVTLGTGFGTGIIIDHKLYSGTLSSAGELGNIPYLDKTIEDYCSGKFFKQEYDLMGDEIFDLAGKGDETALRIFNEFGKHVGNSLKIILNVLSPEAIFLGGSISGSYGYFKSAMEESLNSFPFKKVLEQLVIQPSNIGNISILGSAALIISEVSGQKEQMEPHHRKN